MQALFPEAVLYVPAEQAVHVAPPSPLLYPALQVPADVPPQPLLFASHAVHGALPKPVLYVPAKHAVQVVVPVLQYSPLGQSVPTRLVHDEVELTRPAKQANRIKNIIIIFQNLCNSILHMSAAVS